MAEEKKVKRRWGDRRDGRWCRDVPGMQTLMMHILPKRTDCEVFFQDDFDVTELLKYIDRKNEQHPEYKTTLFHCLICAVAKMVMERPKLNRFIQGRRTYERYDISIGFTMKRRFTDHSDEALVFLTPQPEDTLDTVSERLLGNIQENRKHEHSTDGFDKVMDDFAKIPRLILMLICRIVRWLDFWGLNLKAFTDGDPNYSTVFMSNLGSIKCPSVYHHLNNYGTNSFFLIIGTIHKKKMLMPDGTEEIRDVVDLGATLDERIADGFYFARSLKLIRYICAHPEMLDEPLGTPSNFDFK